MDKQALEALLEKVEAGEILTASDFESIFGMDSVPNHLNRTRGMCAWQSYNGSLDAAKALHEAVLPNATWLLGSAKARALVHTSGGIAQNAESANPARAWLIAIIKALIASLDMGEA